MVELASILPPALASDERMRVLERIYTDRLAALDLAGVVPRLIDTAPEWQLPYLAQEFGVVDTDGWRLALDEDAQRELIKSGIKLRRLQGTPWAVTEVLRLMGIDATIAEWFDTQGVPGTFAIDADVFARTVDDDLFAGAVGAIDRSKPVHAHLARLQLNTASRGPVEFFAVAAVSTISVALSPRGQVI
jgi:phage tail P2-like protein